MTTVWIVTGIFVVVFAICLYLAYQIDKLRNTVDGYRSCVESLIAKYCAIEGEVKVYQDITGRQKQTLDLIGNRTLEHGKDILTESYRLTGNIARLQDLCEYLGVKRVIKMNGELRFVKKAKGKAK